MSNKLFRKKFWYIFPWRVVAFFRKEYKEKTLYLRSISEDEKKELFKHKWRHFISFSVSIVLHIVFFLSVFNGFFNSSLINKKTVVIENVVDFELMDAMVSAPLDPIFDENSDIIINASTLLEAENETEDKQALALDGLLSVLKKSKSPVLSASFDNRRQKLKQKQKQTQNRNSSLALAEKQLKAGLSLGYEKNMGRKANVPRKQLWNHIRLLESDTIDGDANYANIMRVIDQHSFQFRDCYEQALLKDKKLSVKAVIFLTLSQTKVAKTKLKLRGNGNIQSRRALSHCLFQESKVLVFSKNKKNVLVKFNLIFGL